MIMFIDEDQAYRYWITHHRQGFVADGRRRPKVAHVMLHRATCDDVKKAASKRSHWTTGGRLKLCATRLDELETWLRDEHAMPPECCPKCRPDSNEAEAAVEPTHLSKLARDILDYVVESAVIHLECTDGPNYRLTVNDIALCMGKTVGQISAALHALVNSGQIQIEGRTPAESSFDSRRVVWPTVNAVRSLPGFSEDDPALLQQQLEAMVGIGRKV